MRSGRPLRRAADLRETEDADLRRADGLPKTLFVRSQRQLRGLEARDVPPRPAIS